MQPQSRPSERARWSTVQFLPAGLGLHCSPVAQVVGGVVVGVAKTSQDDRSRPASSTAERMQGRGCCSVGVNSPRRRPADVQGIQREGHQPESTPLARRSGVCRVATSGGWDVEASCVTHASKTELPNTSHRGFIA